MLFVLPQSIILYDCDKLSCEFIYMAAASSVAQFGMIYLVSSWRNTQRRRIILSTTFLQYLSNAVSCSL